MAKTLTGMRQGKGRGHDNEEDTARTVTRTWQWRGHCKDKDRQFKDGNITSTGGRYGKDVDTAMTGTC